MDSENFGQQHQTAENPLEGTSVSRSDGASFGDGDAGLPAQLRGGAHQSTPDEVANPRTNRQRKLTEKGMQFSLENNIKKLKLSVDKYNSQIKEAYNLIESDNVQALRDIRGRIGATSQEVADARNSILDVDPSNMYASAQMSIDAETRATLGRIADKLHFLEIEAYSEHSFRSRRSKRSKAPSAKSGSRQSSGQKSTAELIADAAEQLADANAQLQQQEEEAELKKKLDHLERRRQRDRAQARLNALKELPALNSDAETLVPTPSTSSKVSPEPPGPNALQPTSVAPSSVPSNALFDPLIINQDAGTFAPNSLSTSTAFASEPLRRITPLSTSVTLLSASSTSTTFASESLRQNAPLSTTVTSPSASQTIDDTAPTSVGAKTSVTSHSLQAIDNRQISMYQSTATSDRYRQGIVTHSIKNPLSYVPTLATNPVNPAPLENAASQLYYQNDAASEVSSQICSSNTTSSVAIEELMKGLTNQMYLSRVQVLEPSVFSGESLQYPSWKATFDTLVDSRGIPENEKIFYLKRYLGGQAREMIDGYLLIPTADSYKAARALLEQRFGSHFSVANAFRSKLDSWPSIQPRDGPGLRKYADFLQQCAFAMDCVPSLNILNDEHENRKMAKRLPEWLVLRWARVIADWRETHLRFPPFTEFVQLVAKEARIACDPSVSLQSDSSQKPTVSSGNNTSKAKQTSHAMTIKVDPESTSSTQPKPKPHCSLCKAEHSLDDCAQFLKKTYDERREFVLKASLCFGCLRFGHKSFVCRSRKTCAICSRRHPTSLHYDDEPNEVLVNATSAQGSTYDPTHEPSSKTSSVVPVYVSHLDKPGLEVLVYAMLDTQSDTTFILESTLSRLEAPTTDTTLILSTMASIDSRFPSKRVAGLKIRGINSGSIINLPPTYSRAIMPINRAHIPTRETAERWPHLQSLASDIPPLLDCDVGLLIGYNCARALIPRQIIPDPENVGPYGQLTDLGWSIVGATLLSDICGDHIGVSHRVLSFVEDSPNALCRIVQNVRIREAFSEPTLGDCQRILQLDFVEHPGPLKNEPYSQEDVRFLSLVENGIKIGPNGHYQIPLPLREESLPLGSNRETAMTRLRSLEKRFRREPAYHKIYAGIIQDLIEKGYAEPVEGHEDAWFLPHHGVKHPQKPDKVRVVFDAAAKHRGKSLNDVLMSGPDLTNKLVGVLCRFRLEEVALCCDIEAMFHQFEVPVEHRDYLRFLWWKDGDYTSKPVDYRMCVHIFGATSSPACANFGLKQAARDYGHKFSPSAARFITQDFYVDDGLISMSSETEVIKLIQETSEMCRMAGLNLHKFLSNSETVMRAVSRSEVGLKADDENIKTANSSIERVLGVCWYLENDTFGFKVAVKSLTPTRRNVLSTIASIYDPLGLACPVLLLGKLILQDLCRDNLDWDVPLSTEYQLRWEQWLTTIIDLNKLSIARCYKPKQFGEVVHIEIHHFADASLQGYGTCSYMRQVNALGDASCALVMAKSRVVPLKPVTVPRLELTAALVAARMSQLLQKELDSNIQHYFWSDSKVVLAYLHNTSSKYEVFVANRIREIRDTTAVDRWNYIGTKANPADLASRGCTAQELVDSEIWFSGPTFLHQSNWTAGHDKPDANNYQAETTIDEKAVSCCAVASSEIAGQGILTQLSKISSWDRMRRVVAMCIHLPHFIRRELQLGMLNPDHLQHASSVIVALVQREAFLEEIQCLEKGRPVKSNSPLAKLDPFLDGKGLVRIGGRIDTSGLPFHIKHPLVLPKDSPISLAILRHYHMKAAHQGRAMTVNTVRSSGFWILHASRVASSLISKCVTCRKNRSSLCDQKMGSLPFDRIENGPPFTNVGVDFFGPFLIKEGRKEMKRWGCIFTCLSSRAVHLEVATSLSADGFINVLRRFLSIRGPVALIRCDQGTNFVGASSELKAALQENDEKLREYLCQNSCEFTFNVPHASRMGGAWERCIRTVRSVLAALMKDHGTILDDDSLRTVLAEAAAIVNSRPLSVDNLFDPTAPLPITPNHLLTMKTSTVMPPPGNFIRADIYSRKRWRRVQYLMNVFWSRWKREYVHHLQSRQRLVRPRKNLSAGDIVLVVEENVPRAQWHLGRIIETMSSSDGFVRKAKLIVGDTTLNAKGKRVKSVSEIERPVHKLVLLVEA